MSEPLYEDVTNAPPPDGVVISGTDPHPVGGAWRTDVVGQLEGMLAVVGAGFAAAVNIEQQLSTAVGSIPWGPWPAMRIGDFTLGMPHPHLPIAPFPPFGPVARYLPLPQPGVVLDMGFLSGASTVFIDGQKAARCGDMGLCVPLCLGFMPLFEIFFGSATVWIESQRAARVLDPTMHCNMLDQPVGFLKLGLSIGPGSGAVFVGGVPLPSLLDAALGKAIDGIAGGLKRGAGAMARRLRSLNLERLNPLHWHWWRSLDNVPPWSRLTPGPHTILVTHFAPFGGAAANASGRVAAEVKRLWDDLALRAQHFNFPDGVELQFLDEGIDVSTEGVSGFVDSLPGRLPPGNAVVSMGETGLRFGNVRIENLADWAWPPYGGYFCQQLHEAVGASGNWHATFLHVPGSGGTMWNFEGTVDQVIDILNSLANS